MTVPICPECQQPASADVKWRPDGTVVHVECDEIRVFVYGTLRTGGPLSHQLEGMREPAFALDHALHYPKLHRSFPYMVAKPGQNTTGELVRVSKGDAWAMEAVRSLNHMENNAGYDTRTITAQTKGGLIEATAWVWEGSKRYVGPQVPSNDWCQAPEWTYVDDTGFAVAEPEPVVDVSPVEQDDREQMTLYSGPHEGEPWMLRIVDANGVERWRGWSGGEATRWTKANNINVGKWVKVEKPKKNAAQA